MGPKNLLFPVYLTPPLSLRQQRNKGNKENKSSFLPEVRPAVISTARETKET